MARRLIALAVVLLLLAACGEQSAAPAPGKAELPSAVDPPSGDIDLSGPIAVEITTSKGVLSGTLHGEAAPLAVASFINLAEKEYFDGQIFHRIIPGFVVQTGDPTGTGSGGPGYKFPDEPIPDELTYQKGTLAMANSGPNTNGSQFFICLGNLDGRLPRNYTIFGQIDVGLDVLEALAATPLTNNPATGELSKPTETVLVESIRIER